MKVEEFGFGFPPRLCGVRKVGEGANAHWQVVWGNKNVQALEAEKNLPGGTVYSFNWLPLGGFVKIKGEDGVNSDSDSFVAKKAWQKAGVLVAGVFMNVLVAIILLSIGYMVGLPEAVTGQEGINKINDRKLQIIQTLPGKPAEVAGMSAGDIILQVDGMKNPTVADFKNYVDAHKDQAIAVIIEHEKQVSTKSVHPITYPDTGRGGIGVAVIEVGFIKYPWYLAIYNALIATGLYLKEIIFGFGSLIKGLFTGANMGAAVSGPVGVAVMTGQVARLGFTHLLQFMAVLSLNLAILNILPIPALDGGRLLFVIIGKVFRKPVTPRTEQIVHTSGFLLLMVLVLAVTVKDLSAFSGDIIGLWHKIF